MEIFYAMRKIKLKLNKTYPVENKEQYLENLTSIPNDAGLKMSEIDLSDSQNKIALLFSSSSITVAHTTKIKGQNLIIPEINMTIMYYSMSCVYYELIQKIRQPFFDTINTSVIFDNNKDVITKKSYDYFSLVSCFTIFLFTSMEALINSKINKNIQIINKKGEIDNYEKIMWYSFYDKIKKVLDIQQGDSFFKNNATDHRLIEKLKKLRDSIIHAKPQNGNHLDYEEILKTGLNLDYENTLVSVKKFINFYSPNLIEDEDLEEKDL